MKIVKNKVIGTSIICSQQELVFILIGLIESLKKAIQLVKDDVSYIDTSCIFCNTHFELKTMFVNHLYNHMEEFIREKYRNEMKQK